MSEMTPQQMNKMLRHKIELGDSLDILENNPHYKKIIEQAFMVEFCLENAYNMSHPNANKLEGIRNPRECVVSVGTFKYFLNQVRAMAKQAKEDLNKINQQD